LGSPGECGIETPDSMELVGINKILPYHINVSVVARCYALFDSEDNDSH
jgi:hypothetical protein